MEHGWGTGGTFSCGVRWDMGGVQVGHWWGTGETWVEYRWDIWVGYR